METDAPDPSGLDGIPASAESRETTPYDFLIVGSGPGGAPLAARLARGGMKVLVLEAGIDPGAPVREGSREPEVQRAEENQRRMYHSPGLHAAATEPRLHQPEGRPTPAHEQTSWSFWVRHYAGRQLQASDSKAVDDPNEPGRKAVLYPRASALGGCTAHHAMISICGTDTDWQKIADLTGDSSWAPGKMRAIYQRIERASYGVIGGRIAKYWEVLLNFLAPHRASLAERGETGWLDVRTTDPHLALGDPALFKMIVQTIFDEEKLGSGIRLLRFLKRIILGGIFRDFDLNDAQTMRTRPEGAALVPLGVSRSGVRRGPREHLLETRLLLETAGVEDPFAGRLHVATGIFVRRVLFERAADGKPPRAVGVEFTRGRNLYQASSPNPADRGPDGRCFARREIILCGGAFNSPQLLMLSGIGNEAQLREAGVSGLTFTERPSDAPDFIHLPGVGQNLCDRCEIGIVSEMDESFSSLRGVNFSPGPPADRELKSWMAEGTAQPRAGIYTTNGAALAVLRRSDADRERAADSQPGGEPANPPDLFMLGFPLAFRGYYPGWSKELLSLRRGAPPESRNLWTWAILKAYSTNRGFIRLRSNDPFAQPAIQFCYFGESPAEPPNDFQIDEENDDLAALEWGVDYVRKLNRRAASLMKDRDADAAEVQPGADKPSGSQALRDWIVGEAWGHHASGTCRIGIDPWREKTSDLRDQGAVIDSHFRVHGVRGLRVVDASVFPKIPGYFLAVPIYMISEKAAETIFNELSF